MDRYIASIRHSTPGVGLISPPPHHDIYSIEDIKQLIFDLRCANPTARVSVKLVSEVGVGTVAAGVAKANSDHVTIAGFDGGTGASPVSSIHSAGIPWEIGLAETQQTLVENKLRDRIVVQADGQMKTGRDVVVAALLGAEEMGFSTAPLISMGCIMMRACHLNTCPVGIATQDPELIKRFRGQPEHVVNFFFFLAEEVRELMAKLGIRKFEDLVGRKDLLQMDEAIDHWKARGVDLSGLLYDPEHLGPEVARRRVRPQDPVLDDHLDHQIMEKAKATLDGGAPSEFDIRVENKHRCVGGLLSGEIARRFGEPGLPEDSIVVHLTGSAGQSFGGWLNRGVTLLLDGDSNDYTGKGMSGGVVAVKPPEGTTFVAEENVIIGNTSLYGATAGRAFFRGLAGERFAVRNSGVHAVVEGVGDHGCEYMTGGTVVVLGPTGRNFAAGMSGGVAYVLDPDGEFPARCNQQIVELEHAGHPISPRRTSISSGRWCRSTSTARQPGGRARAGRLGRAARRLGEGHAHRLQARAGRDGRARGRRRRRSPPRSAPRRGPRAGWAPVGELGGFLKIHRQLGDKRPIDERVKDFDEYVGLCRTSRSCSEQGARCMECGVPFCHQGCPLGNLIPDWNDLVYRDRWQEAIVQLHATNNFPEFTGRICPAPCEAACVLDINDDPVTIKQIEVSIIDRAWEEGWVKPEPPAVRSGHSVAVVGSGPGRPCRRGRAQPVRPRGHASTSATATSAACSASACRTSSSTRGSSSAAWTSWPRRASSSRPA